MADQNTSPATQPIQPSITGVPYDRFQQVNENMKAYKDLSESQANQLKEANAKIEELGGVVSGYKEKDSTYEKLQSDYDLLIKTQNDSLRSKWESCYSKINVEEGNKNFERNKKILAEFATGEDLSIDDIQRNINTYDILERQGLFTDTQSNHSGDPKGSPPDNTVVEDMFAFKG